MSSTTTIFSLVFVMLFEKIFADASLVQVLLFSSASSLLACLCCSINRRRCPAPSVVFPLNSTAVSIFVDILVELLNTVFVNSANISTNIETPPQSSSHLFVFKIFLFSFHATFCSTMISFDHDAIIVDHSHFITRISVNSKLQS